MKKLLVTICLFVFVIGACSTFAFAEDDEINVIDIAGFEKAPAFENRIDVQYYLGTDSNFENPIIPVKDDIVSNGVIMKDIDVYCNAEKMKITYTPGEQSEIGDEYLVFVRTSNSLSVTESDIVYIDKVELQNKDRITFNVYPSELRAGTTYYIYLRSSGNDENLAEFTPAASFKCYLSYTLGDVDGIDGISANDALFVLQAFAEQRTLSPLKLLAADVDGVKGISANDALYILQAVAHQRIL